MQAEGTTPRERYEDDDEEVVVTGVKSGASSSSSSSTLTKGLATIKVEPIENFGITHEQGNFSITATGHEGAATILSGGGRRSSM